MHTIEAIKRELNGFEVREKIAHYAHTGWDTIAEDDNQRLKWHRLFLRNPTPGFFMLRGRIPGDKADPTPEQ